MQTNGLVGASASAYNEIRKRIFDGTYEGGRHLREIELVGELAVSRTPIRDALRRLHAEGFVMSEPHKGARVVSWTDQDLDDLFGMRLVLESYAGRLAAMRVRDSDIAGLEKLASFMEDETSRRAPGFRVNVAEANNEFHELVVRSAGSANVMSLLGTVVSAPVPDGGHDKYVPMPLVRRAVLHYTLEELERSAGHHREIIAALKQRDSEWAEAVIRTHILASRGALRSRTRTS